MPAYLLQYRSPVPHLDQGKAAGFSRDRGHRPVSRHASLPFTVMGGIKLEHVPELVRAGARRIAVVTAISQAPDIAAETRCWRQRMGAAREAES